jgi:hypothetical protein
VVCPWDTELLIGKRWRTARILDATAGERIDGRAVCTSKVRLRDVDLTALVNKVPSNNEGAFPVGRSVACAPARCSSPGGGPKIAGGSRRITNNNPLSLSSAYALCRPDRSAVKAPPNCPRHGSVDSSDNGVLLLQRVSSWHSSLPQMLFGCPMSSLSVSVTSLHSFQDLNV